MTPAERAAQRQARILARGADRMQLITGGQRKTSDIPTQPSETTSNATSSTQNSLNISIPTVSKPQPTAIPSQDTTSALPQSSSDQPHPTVSVPCEPQLSVDSPQIDLNLPKLSSLSASHTPDASPLPPQQPKSPQNLPSFDEPTPAFVDTTSRRFTPTNNAIKTTTATPPTSTPISQPQSPLNPSSSVSSIATSLSKNQVFYQLALLDYRLLLILLIVSSFVSLIKFPFNPFYTAFNTSPIPNVLLCGTMITLQRLFVLYGKTKGKIDENSSPSFSLPMVFILQQLHLPEKQGIHLTRAAQLLIALLRLIISTSTALFGFILLISSLCSFLSVLI